jgi:hypothetical protein
MVICYRLAWNMGLEEDPAILRSQTAPFRGVIHPFDTKYGTDTGGYLGPEELVTGHANDAQNYGYSAIAPSVFR